MNLGAASNDELPRTPPPFPRKSTATQILACVYHKRTPARRRVKTERAPEASEDSSRLREDIRDRAELGSIGLAGHSEPEVLVDVLGPATHVSA